MACSCMSQNWENYVSEICAAIQMRGVQASALAKRGPDDLEDAASMLSNLISLSARGGEGKLCMLYVEDENTIDD